MVIQMLPQIGTSQGSYRQKEIRALLFFFSVRSSRVGRTRTRGAEQRGFHAAGARQLARFLGPDRAGRQGPAGRGRGRPHPSARGRPRAGTLWAGPAQALAHGRPREGTLGHAPAPKGAAAVRYGPEIVLAPRSRALEPARLGAHRISSSWQGWSNRAESCGRASRFDDSAEFAPQQFGNS